MKRIFIAAIVGVVVCSLSHTGMGYNREKAVEYAVAWGVPNLVNSAVYYDYSVAAGNPFGLAGGDCANFGSQCLIAGGIRFRSRTSSGPDNDNTTTDMRDECGTGKDTWRIASGDQKKYSRTIIEANELVGSITHSRHGGANVYTAFGDDDNVWNDVQPGDLFMKHIGWPTNYSHTMFIDDVAAGPPKDIYYCAHSNWQSHAKALTVVPTWKTSDKYRIVCLPDAPTITDFAPYKPNGPYYNYARANRWVSGGESSLYKVGKEALYIYVTFDTDMDTSIAATVKLQLGPDVTFGAQSGAGYVNGWWTNANAGRKVKNRTWCGAISEANMPVNKNGWFYVSVRARAKDGSYNDQDDDLAKYSASAACTLFRMRVDTRRDSGEGK